MLAHASLCRQLVVNHLPAHPHLFLPTADSSASPAASCPCPLNLLHFPESSVWHDPFPLCLSHCPAGPAGTTLEPPSWPWVGWSAHPGCSLPPNPGLSHLSSQCPPAPTSDSEPSHFSLCHPPWLCRAQNHPNIAGARQTSLEVAGTVFNG